MSSSSSLSSNKRTFNRLYANYRDFIDKVADKRIPARFALKNRLHLVKSVDVGKIKKQHIYVFEDAYTIRKITPTDQIVTSRTYATVDKNELIVPTESVIEWLRTMLDNLKIFVNKADKTSRFAQLPTDLKRHIVSQTGDASNRFRGISTTFRNDIPYVERPYYLAINHPKFVHAFIATLKKYETKETEARIRATYQNSFNAYNNLIAFRVNTSARTNELQSSKTNIFQDLISMYYKLFNISKFNPLYIYELARVYDNYTLICKHFMSTQAFSMLNVVKYELYKVYLVMYLHPPNDNTFHPEHIGHITGYLNFTIDSGVMFDLDMHRHFWAILPRPETDLLLYINYLRVHSAPINNIRWFTRYYEKILEKPRRQPIDIIIPSSESEIRDLHNSQIGITNFINCRKYMLTHPNAVTKYSKRFLQYDITCEPDILVGQFSMWYYNYYDPSRDHDNYYDYSDSDDPNF